MHWQYCFRSTHIFNRDSNIIITTSMNSTNTHAVIDWNWMATWFLFFFGWGSEYFKIKTREGLHQFWWGSSTPELACAERYENRNSTSLKQINVPYICFGLPVVVSDISHPGKSMAKAWCVKTQFMFLLHLQFHNCYAFISEKSLTYQDMTTLTTS